MAARDVQLIQPLFYFGLIFKIQYGKNKIKEGGEEPWPR